MKKESINICMNKNNFNYEQRWTAKISGLVILYAINDIKKKGSKIKTEFMFKKYCREVIDSYKFLTIEENCCNFLRLSNFPFTWIKYKAKEFAKKHYKDRYWKVTIKDSKLRDDTIYRGKKENIEVDYKKHYKNNNLQILKIKEIKNIFVDKLN